MLLMPCPGDPANIFSLRCVQRVSVWFPYQITPQWPLIIQCSSIGSLGPTPEAWVETELASNLGRGSRSVQLVYPSKSNVLNSLDGILGGGCLPYSRYDLLGLLIFNQLKLLLKMDF